jgi:L-cysteine desulfidase
MKFADYLSAEWRASLGCTEPAAIAYAAAIAASHQHGEVRLVRLVCDARTYKNCHSVGIPNSERRTGLLWTLAIGAHLADHSLGLRCFEQTDARALQAAGHLVQQHGIHVEVAPGETALFIDVTVVRESGTARVVVTREHTHVSRIEVDGRQIGGVANGTLDTAAQSVRDTLAAMSVAELLDLAGSLEAGDRALLQEGAELNIAMARHGLGLFPAGFIAVDERESPANLSRLVAAGVFGRMSGEPFTVMSLAGSGNKGITVAVPLTLYGRDMRMPAKRIDEALALACLLTSATTWHLGTLSALCGAAIAGGIGIAAGVVHLHGGSLNQISLAIGTMVGNLAGMICDGAKIGCAMKTMTGVDAAFRAANLALLGMGIPVTDGIVGADAETSLLNLGRLARYGMATVDSEILTIMQDKLKSR